jgi:hypothetical protein
MQRYAKDEGLPPWDRTGSPLYSQACTHCRVLEERGRNGVPAALLKPARALVVPLFIQKAARAYPLFWVRPTAYFFLAPSLPFRRCCLPWQWPPQFRALFFLKCLHQYRASSLLETSTQFRAPFTDEFVSMTQ